MEILIEKTKEMKPNDTWFSSCPSNSSAGEGNPKESITLF